MGRLIRFYMNDELVELDDLQAYGTVHERPRRNRVLFAERLWSETQVGGATRVRELAHG